MWTINYQHNLPSETDYKIIEYSALNTRLPKKHMIIFLIFITVIVINLYVQLFKYKVFEGEGGISINFQPENSQPENIYNWTIDITNNKNFFLIKDNNDEFLASYNNTKASNLTTKTTDTDYTARWIFLYRKIKIIKHLK